MKLLLLFLVSNISISLIWATALQYDKKKYLSLDSLSQTHHVPLRSPQLENTNNVDSFELIPIEHLLSQQDPTLTPRDLLTLRHQRSLLRAEALSSSSSTPASQRLFFGDDTYLMQLGVGMPAPQNVYLSLNTGSDVVWLQCLPCKKCYNQSDDPIFDPRNSSTFSPIDCGDSRCKQVQYNSEGCDNNTCLYNATYSSGWFSQGAFSTETLTLGNTTNLKNIALGCGHDNQGNWSTDSAGVLGLGRGDLSFITQTKDQFQGQFSYCLADPYSNTRSSSIVFGPSEVTQTAVYTPLIYTNTTTMFYYVNLTEISVNGARVPGIDPSVFDLNPNGYDGGVILDSGTAYTHLIKEAYVALRDAFREAIKKQTNASVSVGPPLDYLWFDTCYNIPFGMLGDVEVPIVELHFDQGANMTLPADNTMIRMYDDGTVATYCNLRIYRMIGTPQSETFNSRVFGSCMTCWVVGSGSCLRLVEELPWILILPINRQCVAIDHRQGTYVSINVFSLSPLLS